MILTRHSEENRSIVWLESGVRCRLTGSRNSCIARNREPAAINVKCKRAVRVTGSFSKIVYRRRTVLDKGTVGFSFVATY
jgi:hypothetical protein